MRFLIYALIAVSASFANAEAKLSGFKWMASGRFFLKIQTSQDLVELKGDLKDDGQTRVEADGQTVTAEMLAFREGFVAIILTELGSDTSNISILERQNGRYVKIHKVPIQAESGKALEEISGSLKALKVANGWDPSLSFRALVGYFSENQGKKMTDFYDAVEVGHIKTMPKPQGRGDLPTRRERPGQYDVHPQEDQQQQQAEGPQGQDRQPPQGQQAQRGPQDPYGRDRGYIDPYGNDMPPPGFQGVPMEQRRQPRQQRPRRQRPPNDYDLRFPGFDPYQQGPQPPSYIDPYFRF